MGREGWQGRRLERQGPPPSPGTFELLTEVPTGECCGRERTQEGCVALLCAGRKQLTGPPPFSAPPPSLGHIGRVAFFFF